MRRFGFRVVLAGLSQASEGLAHALYDAGCTDTSVSSQSGVVAVQFQRQSDSLEIAMLEARGQIEAAGFEIQRIEIDSQQLSAIASEVQTIAVGNHWR
ncbi:hypothetical protein [Neorhodopirellula pilleata]|uniref:Uncharacterized protein n=1 Tax=Neorhodopirellula pilleata TaxID=2714738 RepID=A0A5C6A163_9BACT|nr:hypothetical protein [Neorhodopirellula pilleata]TWT93050.1 hypothetical protein Pla100_43660 [Neorhodopirellula pilleata]